ncbi:hypothetical protein ABIB54_000573 [Frigoribacterium sp. UYMn621]
MADTIRSFFPFIDPAECANEHRPPAGPNMDISVCRCGMPIGVMRPKGQSFGWHADDCSLHVNHPGYCVGGGNGHTIPEGETIRG